MCKGWCQMRSFYIKLANVGRETGCGDCSPQSVFHTLGSDLRFGGGHRHALLPQAPDSAY